MKISLKWLDEYVHVPASIKELCDRFDLTGTGVEAVEKVGEAFENVVTGQIIEKTPHPDSDHLWVTKVDVGEKNLGESSAPEPLQIVCGAQNFKEGDHVVVAMIGAVLPGDVTIKKSKLRGITSFGMNCSARELGVGSDHEGIWILPEDAPIGVPFADYQGIGDTVLDLEITPNRPDCLSMVGMAREVGAMYDLDITYPTYELKESNDPVDKRVSVNIADSARCPRYTARVIEGVKVGPSPDWLAERITAAGARPINNVVDATNYVLFLLGQPLHAFDFDTLATDGKMAHIIVRAAEEGERLVTLDEEDRALTSDMTVISTPERAVALAGVMGGLATEVTEATTTVLLEAATFSPAHTSRTSRNLSLISESSLRYERGVDDNSVDFNAAFAAALIADVCGGTVMAGIVDAWPEKTERRNLVFRVDRFNAFIGADIPLDFITQTLTRLGCEVSQHSAAESDGSSRNSYDFIRADSSDSASVGIVLDVPGGTSSGAVLDVTVPTFRPDLEREIDLYEEVLRLYGMDRIPSTLPGGRGRIGVRTAEEQKATIINNVMRASGLNETMTYSFASPDDLSWLRMSEEGLGQAVELINPINADQSQLRRSLIPGLVRSVAYNQSHGVKNIQLYEIGTVFFGSEGKKQPKERKRLSAVLTGAMGDKGWNVEQVPFDFFDGKGIIENLCRELAVPKLRFKAASADDVAHLQPGRAAHVLSGGTTLGWIGEIHPLAADAFDADFPIVAFELDFEALLRASRPARDWVDIPTYPAVTMDIALVVDEDVTNEQLVHVMRSAGGKLLESVQLFDVYRDDERVGIGKKSMAYALAYRADDRTLTSEEVDKAHERLVKKVAGATGSEVRG